MQPIRPGRPYCPESALPGAWKLDPRAARCFCRPAPLSQETPHVHPTSWRRGRHGPAGGSSTPTRTQCRRRGGNTIRRAARRICANVGTASSSISTVGDPPTSARCAAPGRVDGPYSTCGADRPADERARANTPRWGRARHASGLWSRPASRARRQHHPYGKTPAALGSDESALGQNRRGRRPVRGKGPAAAAAAGCQTRMAHALLLSPCRLRCSRCAARRR